MTNFLKTKVVRNPNIITHKFDGRTYLLDPQRNVIRELNETAGFIWRNAGKSITADKLVTKIVSRFDVLPKTATEDLSKYVKKYLKAGLFEIG